MPRTGNPWYDSYHRNKFRPGTGVFTRCFGCNTPYSASLSTCPTCGLVRDREKNKLAEKRAGKNYFDIVRQNTARAGKNVKKEVYRVRSIRRYGYGISEASSRELNPKLDAYIQKRKKPGRMFFARPHEKLCMDCEQLFTANIRGNRFGGQKRCRRCQDYANYERNAIWQKQHYKKRTPTT